ncbi:hypothetical protein [Mucilaginibacter antarcticus]|uniref:Nucleotide-diphospho-sugar transferase n=1 Tax=Mucilaginibacter antarcticus TaxID=1855725 RepID=A0ABW5XPB8_9SPHI
MLFIVFNRPETTIKVFAAIREARPTRLYIAADGPRPGNQSDIDNQKAVKEIVSKVDWACDVRTLYREHNLGCGKGPATAYDWFFEHEEEGIILEDDCLPDQSFFRYCQELLKKYRHDTKIMHIAGSNFQKGWKSDEDYSYYFSSYPHEWGWATWRRAWKLYDFDVKDYPELIKKDYFKGYFDSELEQKYRLSKIKNSYNNPNVNWWDYQWSFTLFSHSGLAIIPNTNMIENIGFGANATHTLSANDELKQNKAQPLEFPLKHPSFVIRDSKSDHRYFNKLLFSIFKRKIFSLFRIKGYNFGG